MHYNINPSHWVILDKRWACGFCTPPSVSEGQDATSSSCCSCQENGGSRSVSRHLRRSMTSWSIVSFSGGVCKATFDPRSTPTTQIGVNLSRDRPQVVGWCAASRKLIDKQRMTMGISCNCTRQAIIEKRTMYNLLEGWLHIGHNNLCIWSRPIQLCGTPYYVYIHGLFSLYLVLSRTW